MKIALVSLCTVNGGLNPIGVLCLAAFIRKLRPQDDVKILEATKCDLITEIVRGQFDVVGLSAMTLEYESAWELSGRIKQVSMARVVVGGVHISIMPESFRHAFDVGVMDEGEHALCEVLDAIEQDRGYESILGAVWFKDGKLIINQRRPPISLEDYPPLPWDLLPKSYWQHRALGLFGDFGVEAEILTTRGCPFRCTFCATALFWGAVRAFPAIWIMRELAALRRLGVTHVQIVDDLFTVNKRRLREYVTSIRANGFHRALTFAANSKASVIDDEICELLKSMNCPVVGFGFESGNERVLQMLKGKSASIQTNRDAITLCAKHGLHSVGGFIFGSPTETLAEMRDSIEFIRWAFRAGAGRLFAFVLIPYPGTAMWDIARTRGTVSADMDFRRLDLNPENGSAARPILLDAKIRPEDWSAIMAEATRAVHPFKTRKILMFLRNAPIQTLRYALRAPWSLLARFLNPSKL